MTSRAPNERSNIKESLEKRMHSPYPAKRARTSSHPQSNNVSSNSFAPRFPVNPLEEQHQRLLYQRVLGYQQNIPNERQNNEFRRNHQSAASPSQAQRFAGPGGNLAVSVSTIQDIQRLHYAAQVAHLTQPTTASHLPAPPSASHLPIPPTASHHSQVQPSPHHHQPLQSASHHPQPPAAAPSQQSLKRDRYEPQGNHRPPSLPISAQHPHLVKPPQHLLPPAVVQSHKINHPLNMRHISESASRSQHRNMPGMLASPNNLMGHSSYSLQYDKPLHVETSNHIKREPMYIPQVEAISPTPDDPKQIKRDAVYNQTKQEKEDLLDTMNKMDVNINTLELELKKLRRKQHQLELCKFSPRIFSNDDSFTSDRSTIEIIYSENRKLASQAREELLSGTGIDDSVILPLYHQPCDNEVYHNNMRKFVTFKKRLILYFKQQQKKNKIREKYLEKNYNDSLSKWQQKLEKNESKKRARDIKYRELFEKVFPEIKKQREDKQRLTTRIGTKKRVGSYARTEAELDQIVDGLHVQEEEEKKIRTYAIIPPLMLPKEQQDRAYISTNLIWEDAKEAHMNRKLINIWTEEEKRTFKDKFIQHPKQFSLIANSIPKKSSSDCVLYYYRSKKTIGYKQLIRRNTVRKRKFGKGSNNVGNDKDDVNIDEDEYFPVSSIKNFTYTLISARDKHRSSSPLVICKPYKQCSNSPNKPIENKIFKDLITDDSIPISTIITPTHNPAITCTSPILTNGLPDEAKSVTSTCSVCNKIPEDSKTSYPTVTIVNKDITCITCSNNRKSRHHIKLCPMPKCRTAKHKVKRLKLLPSKLFELSSPYKERLFNDLYITESITKCCPACFNRITRLISSIHNDNELMNSSSKDIIETPRWTEEEINLAKQGFKEFGRNWCAIANSIGSKSISQCKNFYYNYQSKYHLEDLIDTFNSQHKVNIDRRTVSMCESTTSTLTAASEDDICRTSDDDDDDDDGNSGSDTDSVLSGNTAIMSGINKDSLSITSVIKQPAKLPSLQDNSNSIIHSRRTSPACVGDLINNTIVRNLLNPSVTPSVSRTSSPFVRKTDSRKDLQVDLQYHNHSSSPRLTADTTPKYNQNPSTRSISPLSMMSHMQQRDHGHFPISTKSSDIPQDLSWRSNSLSSQANAQVKEAHNAFREYEQRFRIQQSSPKNKLHNTRINNGHMKDLTANDTSAYMNAAAAAAAAAAVGGSITHGTAAQHPIQMQRPGGSISMGTASVPSNTIHPASSAPITQQANSLSNYIDPVLFARYGNGLMEQRMALYGTDAVNQMQYMQAAMEQIYPRGAPNIPPGALQAAQLAQYTSINEVQQHQLSKSNHATLMGDYLTAHGMQVAHDLHHRTDRNTRDIIPAPPQPTPHNVNYQSSTQSQPSPHLSTPMDPHNQWPSNRQPPSPMQQRHNVIQSPNTQPGSQAAGASVIIEAHRRAEKEQQRLAMINNTASRSGNGAFDALTKVANSAPSMYGGNSLSPNKHKSPSSRLSASPLNNRSLSRLHGRDDNTSYSNSQSWPTREQHRESTFKQNEWPTNKTLRYPEGQSIQHYGHHDITSRAAVPSSQKHHSRVTAPSPTIGQSAPVQSRVSTITKTDTNEDSSQHKLYTAASLIDAIITSQIHQTIAITKPTNTPANNSTNSIIRQTPKTVTSPVPTTKPYRPPPLLPPQKRRYDVAMSIVDNSTSITNSSQIPLKSVSAKQISSRPNTPKSEIPEDPKVRTVTLGEHIDSIIIQDYIHGPKRSSTSCNSSSQEQSTSRINTTAQMRSFMSQSSNESANNSKDVNNTVVNRISASPSLQSEDSRSSLHSQTNEITQNVGGLIGQTIKKAMRKNDKLPEQRSLQNSPHEVSSLHLSSNNSPTINTADPLDFFNLMLSDSNSNCSTLAASHQTVTSLLTKPYNKTEPNSRSSSNTPSLDAIQRNEDTNSKKFLAMNRIEEMIPTMPVTIPITPIKDASNAYQWNTSPLTSVSDSPESDKMVIDEAATNSPPQIIIPTSILSTNIQNNIEPIKKIGLIQSDYWKPSLNSQDNQRYRYGYTGGITGNLSTQAPLCKPHAQPLMSSQYESLTDDEDL